MYSDMGKTSNLFQNAYIMLKTSKSKIKSNKI